jgi:thioredoxin reductase
MTIQTKQDYAVIGFSIAGIAAALELASAGSSVSLINYLYDTTDVPGFLFVGPTGLNGQELPGSEFEALAMDALDKAGVRVETGLILTGLHAEFENELPLQFVGDFAAQQRPLSVNAAIFAPNGTEPGLSSRLGVEKFFGYGVSYSAWADGRFFRGKPVAVIGCGNRALEEGCIAAEWASSTTVICQDTLKNATDSLRARVAANRSIVIRTGAQLDGILSDGQSTVSGVTLVENGERKHLEVSAVFVAQDLISDWSLWGDEHRAKVLGDQKKLFVSGLARGIEYWDHGALYADGIRAARQCLNDTTASTQKTRH